MRYDLETLQRESQAGVRNKYVFFWSHRPRVAGVVDRSCFSQWYPASFVVEGDRYGTAEHYMMAEKARLFGDEEVRARILAASSPGEVKQLGREVRGFDEARWTEARFGIVARGNQAKFAQHPELRAFLLGTGRRVLVEASPTDRVWGIGLAEQDERATDPLSWQGLNLLGFALMTVRAELSVETGG